MDYSGRLIAYRIGEDRPWPLWSGEGSKRLAGRWHSRVQGRDALGIVYASTAYGTALLETMVHNRMRRLPRSLRFLTIDIPSSVSRRAVEPSAIHGWDRPDMEASRTVGDAWLLAAETAVLLVPSVPAPLDRNLVINLDHPDSRRIKVSDAMPVITDPRLQALA